MEISKLRLRLKNVQKNVIEYRMSVAEAIALLKEIDMLEAKSIVAPTIVYIEKPVQQSRSIDGGSFS